MSLLNQMLRDLDQRKSNDLNSPSLKYAHPIPKATAFLNWKSIARNLGLLFIVAISVWALTRGYYQGLSIQVTPPNTNIPAIPAPASPMMAVTPTIRSETEIDHSLLTSPSERLQSIIMEAWHEVQNNQPANALKILQTIGPTEKPDVTYLVLLSHVYQQLHFYNNLSADAPVSTPKPIPPVNSNKATAQSTNSKVTKPVKSTSITKKTPLPKSSTTKPNQPKTHKAAEPNRVNNEPAPAISQDLNDMLKTAASLMRDQHVSEAKALLESASKEFPGNETVLRAQAQLLLQLKQPMQAIRLLESVTPGKVINETHEALLAAAYQQAGQYRQAAKVYQILISKNASKGEYWLGLALAEERNGNASVARAAYEEALSKNKLNPDVQNYIRQRLNELNTP